MKDRVIRVVMCVCALALLMGAGGSGCAGITEPEQPAASPCQTIDALTCISNSFSGGSTCCLVASNANASAGYLCVLGFDQGAGCFGTLSEARRICGDRSTVVRCTF